MEQKQSRSAIQRVRDDTQILLRNIPAVVVALFVVSVISMNLFANKSMNIPVSWIAADCGICVSWLSFLCMDMITKRFGPVAAIKISIMASIINLVFAAFTLIISHIPGTWAAFFSYENDVVNQALDETFAGTWYILMGSTIAFLVSSVVNALLNHGIGKMMKKDNFAAYAARSYISTLIAQFIDNFTFAIIVSHTFFGWTLIQCITCSAIGCVLELVCEVIFSPIGYKVCKQWEIHGVGQHYIDYRRNVS